MTKYNLDTIKALLNKKEAEHKKQLEAKQQEIDKLNQLLNLEKALTEPVKQEEGQTTNETLEALEKELLG